MAMSRLTRRLIVSRFVVGRVRHRVFGARRPADCPACVTVSIGRQGASRQSRAPLLVDQPYGSSFDARGGRFLRGSGQAEDSALTIGRRPTPRSRSIARADNPARASRRIAA
jgi:hypothetical protein